MDTLQLLQDLECYLARDLSETDGGDVLAYLNDKPLNTTPRYLAELFGFKEG